MDQIKPMDVSTCANVRKGSDERLSDRSGVAWRPLKNSGCVLNHDVITLFGLVTFAEFSRAELSSWPRPVLDKLWGKFL